MAFTDICFMAERANGIWEIPIGTAPGTPVAPGLSIIDSLEYLIDQIGNIGVATSPLNKSASGFVLTTGSQVNSYTDALGLNAVYHQISDTAGVLDAYYEFDVGGGIAGSFKMTGRLASANDYLDILAWDWVSSAWTVIAHRSGTSGSSDSVNSGDLLARHVGTGGDLGKVRIRYYGTGLTSATLYVDQIFVSYSVAAPTAAEIQAIVAPVKAKTDQFAFTIANQVDANALSGGGGGGGLDAAGVRAAVGLASANLDTQFTSIPAAVWAAGTRTLSSFGSLAADVATAVWGAGTRTLTGFGSLAADAATAVWGSVTRTLTAGTNIVLAKGTGLTGLNDLSAAQVNAEADTAISDAALATAANLGLVKSKTDQMVFTVPNQIDANALTGGGGGGGLDAQGVRDAIGMAAADLDAQLDGIAGDLAAVTTPSITVVSPVVAGGDVRMFAGYDYTVGSGQPLEWALSGVVDLTGATVDVVNSDPPESSYGFSITVLGAGGPVQTIRAEVTASQTLALGDPGGRSIFPFRIKATLPSLEQVVLVDARMTIA